MNTTSLSTSAAPSMTQTAKLIRVTYIALLVFAIVAPLLGLYPVFVMKLLCFAIFACAFNLLLGFTGLLSFGHAAFFGSAAYVTGWLIKSLRRHTRSRHPGRYRDSCGPDWSGGGRRGHSPPGHLFRHDHAGHGTNGVFCIAAGTVYRW